MKIAVTARGPGMDDAVDPRFGRCAWFVIVDTDTQQSEPIQNQHATQGGGAGIQAGQLMANHNVQTVLTGSCGPNAFQTLSAAGIQVILNVGGTVREVVERFKAGGLSATSGPNMPSHSGER